MSKVYQKLNGNVSVGSCCHTGAGDLPCAQIIHAVGPVWDTDQPMYDKVWGKVEEVAATLRSILRKADQLGCKIIVIPMLYQGTFGFTKALYARTYFEEL
jgi:O-acetyl-ADP-ribose deacetylase (regulator of RNase III)